MFTSHITVSLLDPCQPCHSDSYFDFAIFHNSERMRRIGASLSSRAPGSRKGRHKALTNKVSSVRNLQKLRKFFPFAQNESFLHKNPKIQSEFQAFSMSGRLPLPFPFTFSSRLSMHSNEGNRPLLSLKVHGLLLSSNLQM